MAKITEQRMTKRSRLRRMANRALPAVLANYRATKLAAAVRAVKVPHPPRLLQRKRRLEAMEKEKKRLAEERKRIVSILGRPPLTVES